MTGEEALARIRKSLQQSADETPAAKSLIEKIRSGKATYQDTALYARWAATNLGLSLSHVVCDIDLSDRAAVCKALLLDQYEDINGFVDMVQAELDSSFGIHLAPQRAPFAAERADTIGQSLADTTKPDDVIRRRAQSATATATKAIHDDRMKAEADFRSRAGLKCYITRTAVGGCCPWCSDVAGRYEYGEEPDDIYRRHDNCDCTVTFENGRQRQDVWSKRTWEVPGKDAGAADATVLTAEQAAEIEAKHQPTVLTKIAPHGIIKSRGMANGERRSRDYILTDEDIIFVIQEASAIGIPPDVFLFNIGERTGFRDSIQKITIRGDVFPDLESRDNRDQLSVRATLAHEYYGHYKAYPSPYGIDDWRDEFNASYRAALDTPNLSVEERARLMIDAYDRARHAGVILEYDEEARRIIYG